MRRARRLPRALVPWAPDAAGVLPTPLGPTAAPRRAPGEAWEGARGGGDGWHVLGGVGKRWSPWQGSSCRRLEVAGGFWPLQNSKPCHQRGLSGTAKRHYASAAGVCGRYQENSSCAAASSCGVSSWAIPRPARCHSIFSDFLPVGKIFFRYPWPVFLEDDFPSYLSPTLW